MQAAGLCTILATAGAVPVTRGMDTQPLTRIKCYICIHTRSMVNPVVTQMLFALVAGVRRPCARLCTSLLELEASWISGAVRADSQVVDNPLAP